MRYYSRFHRGLLIILSRKVIPEYESQKVSDDNNFCVSLSRNYINDIIIYLDLMHVQIHFHCENMKKIRRIIFQQMLHTKYIH